MSQPAVGDVPAAPAGGRPPRQDPLKKTVRDVALSMGVVAGIIFLVLIVTWRPQPDPIRTVDPAPVAGQAAQVVDYPLLLPSLDEAWRATSARFEPTEESDNLPVWFNGWVSPGEQFAAVVQSANTTESFIEEQTIDGLPAQDAPPTPGWDAVVSPRNDQRSLVRIADGHTTIVTGSVGWQELIAFRDALQPVGSKGDV